MSWKPLLPLAIIIASIGIFGLAPIARAQSPIESAARLNDAQQENSTPPSDARDDLATTGTQSSSTATDERENSDARSNAPAPPVTERTRLGIQRRRLTRKRMRTRLGIQRRRLTRKRMRRKLLNPLRFTDKFRRILKASTRLPNRPNEPPTIRRHAIALREISPPMPKSIATSGRNWDTQRNASAIKK